MEISLHDIIKISQTTWKKIGYLNSSQLFHDNNLDLSIFLKKNKTNPQTKQKREMQSVFWEITIFWVFAQLYFKRTPSHFFSYILPLTAHEHFTRNDVCVFLTVDVLKAVGNLLSYISTEAHLDLFLKGFQLAYS